MQAQGNSFAIKQAAIFQHLELYTVSTPDWLSINCAIVRQLYRLAGEFQIPGMPIKSSAYPEEPDYRAPALGEHNREILRDFLKRSDVEIDALMEAGVLASGEY